MLYKPQIVIIGAGIVGLSTAYALLQRGTHRVLVLEQAVVNHTRATSSSISRLLRFEYGADPFYAQMVQQSLKLWLDLEKKTHQRLYVPTGLLSLGREGDETREAHEIACQFNLPSELLSEQDCRQRFPEFSMGGYHTWNFNAEGGILRASICLQTLKRAILDLGGEIREVCRVAQIFHEQPGSPISLQLSSGGNIAAERVVVALGPWVQHLLSHLHLPLKLTRQYLLYFAGLSPQRFGVGIFPAFMDNDLYGFPIHEGSRDRLKVASHRFGRAVDPDEPVQMEEAVIAQTVQLACTLLPALREATLADVEACIYDVSPDEDFILDSVPGDPRIIFATGLSGHGFKFGPLLGHILSDLVCETQPVISLARFSLARFSHQPQEPSFSVA